jgi:CheY-like chemotaxis protein
MSTPLLLVDDDEFQHLLVGDFLRDHGYDVTHCESAEAALQAIAACEQATPALVIVDLHMPGMNGLEFISRLRKPARERSHGCTRPASRGTCAKDFPAKRPRIRYAAFAAG